MGCLLSARFPVILSDPKQSEGESKNLRSVDSAKILRLRAPHSAQNDISLDEGAVRNSDGRSLIAPIKSFPKEIPQLSTFNFQLSIVNFSQPWYDLRKSKEVILLKYLRQALCILAFTLAGELLAALIA